MADPPSSAFTPNYAQLQHILSVTGLPAIDSWCYVPWRAPLRLDVLRDDAYIARLLAAEEMFSRRLTGLPPDFRSVGIGDEDCDR